MGLKGLTCFFFKCISASTAANIEQDFLKSTWYHFIIMPYPSFSSTNGTANQCTVLLNNSLFLSLSLSLTHTHTHTLCCPLPQNSETPNTTGATQKFSPLCLSQFFHCSLHWHTHINPLELSRLCWFTEADKEGARGCSAVCVYLCVCV